jgi:hypothetical protein
MITVAALLVEVRTMFRSSFFTVFLLVASLHACASETSDLPTLSRRQLSTVIKSAHTGAQYRQLAIYFSLHADRFDKLAESRREDLDRQLQHNFGGSKFPNEADRGRRWIDYYVEQARLMRRSEEEFKKKALFAEQGSFPAGRP